MKRRREGNIKMDIQWRVMTVSISAGVGTSGQLLKQFCVPSSCSVLQRRNTTDRLIRHRYRVQKVSLVAPTTRGIIQLWPNFTDKFFLFSCIPWVLISPTNKETSSETCQGCARFQQHRDASSHQVVFSCKARRRRKFTPFHNNIYLLQLGCHPMAVVILHVYKIWNWLLINLSRDS